ncbi:MAG: GNAT family N-acetyltransferase [Bacteroidota bacterium]
MVEIIPLIPTDLDAVLDLWKRTEGISIRNADSHEALLRYLHRNPAHSFKAVHDRRLVGAVLSGHDGRRGYLHHLAVDPAYRKQGVGKALVERCLSGLREEGIEKSHVLVLADNAGGRAFWAKLGWVKRDDLVLFSQSDSPDA